MDTYKILLSYTALVSLLLGINILRKDIRKPIHWVFLIKALILALFALLAIFIQDAHTPAEAQFWYKYYTLAMLIQPLTFFLFYTLLIPSNRPIRIIRRILVVGFAFVAAVWASVPPAEFCEYVKTGDFWIVSETSTATAVNIQVLYLTIVPLLLFAFILIWHVKCRTNKEKHHSRLVLLSLFLVYTLSFLADCLHIRIIALPHITPMIFFIYLFTVYYAHTRYYFLDNDLKSHYEEMLDNSSDIFLFLDKELCVEKSNAVAREELGIPRRRMAGMPFEELLHNPDEMEQIKEAAEGTNPQTDYTKITLRFKTEGDLKIYKTSVNRVRDKFNDYLGLYLFAHTDKEINSFQTGYGISPKQMEVFHLILRGLTNADISDKLFISRRTTETHISALYTKLGVTNKIELFNLARDAGFL